MEFVEILRARKVLRNYALVLLTGFVLTAISLFSGHATVNVEGGHTGTVEFSSLLVGCAFVAFIIATCIAPGLSAESSTLAITWTRPVPRGRIAARFIAVDLAAIVVSFVLMLVVTLIFLAMFGFLGTLHFNGARAAAVLGLGLGCTVMWYGLVTLASTRLPGRGGMIAGLSWVAFLVLGGLWAAPFPPLIHGLIVLLNYLNPLAYFGNHLGGAGNPHQIIPFGDLLRTLVTWCIGIAALIGTVRLWSTREV
jgi:hypothetical protein